MDIKAVYDVAFAIIISLGGGGIIVFALSSWLGKVWANRILVMCLCARAFKIGGEYFTLWVSENNPLVWENLAPVCASSAKTL